MRAWREGKPEVQTEVETHATKAECLQDDHKQELDRVLGLLVKLSRNNI